MSNRYLVCINGLYFSHNWFSKGWQLLALSLTRWKPNLTFRECQYPKARSFWMAKPSKVQQCPRYTVGKRKYRLPNPKGLILLFDTSPVCLFEEFSSAQLERKNKEKKKKKKRKIRYPKNYDPALNALPDPERWLPKRERSYYKSTLSFVGMLLWPLMLANQDAARRT